MSDGLWITESSVDLAWCAGAVCWDGYASDVRWEGDLKMPEALHDWYAEQLGVWKKTLLMRLPCTCEIHELELDLKLLLSGRHRMEVAVWSRRKHAEASFCPPLGRKRVPVYHSSVMRAYHDGSFEGQVFVNSDSLLILKGEVLELSLELRCLEPSTDEAVAQLLLELSSLGAKRQLLFQLSNLSSVALQA